jgi:hypothetical protein
MRLNNIYGHPVKLNVAPYLIKWDRKSRSIIQFKTKQFLYPYWKSHLVYEEFPVFGSQLKVDILNATKKIAIEVHGPQHEEFHYFHNGSRATYLKGIKNDESKARWLELNGFALKIIYWHEVDSLSKTFFRDKFGIEL